MPKSLSVSPTEKNWTNSVIQSLRQTLDERKKNIHYLRRMRYMRLKSNAPKPFQRVIAKGLQSPFSYRLVQTAAGLLVGDRPHFERLPLKPSDKEAAGRLQKSADPLLQTYEYMAKKPLLWMGADQVLTDGEGHAKVFRVPWSGFPLKREEDSDEEYNKRVAKFILSFSPAPLRMKLVDSLNMLIPPTEFEPPYVVEQGKRPTLPTVSGLGLTFGVNNKLMEVPTGAPQPELELPRGVPPTIDVEELWTDEFVFVRIGGEVHKFENDLGFIPYTSTTGEVSSSFDPALFGLSILYPYQGIEPWLNTMLSTLAAWSVLGGVPILWTSRRPVAGMPTQPDTAGALSEIPLGKRIDLGIGGEIGFVQPPPVGREVLEFINLLVQFLDRAGITPLASGIMGTRTPGTAFNAALEAAVGKLKPVQHNLENWIADWVRLSWRIIDEVVKQPVWVTGTTLERRPLTFGRKPVRGHHLIDPKDIDGYYDVRATLKMSNLQDTISRGMHAAFMKAHGLWTRERAMKFADVDDPWEEFMGVLVNRFQDSPLVQSQILQGALAEDEELARRAAELQAQGIDLTELLTGQPGGMAPGTAGGGSVSVFGGAPQPRGQPAPSAGGRPRGMNKRGGGTRRGQGTMFAK